MICIVMVRKHKSKFQNACFPIGRPFNLIFTHQYDEGFWSSKVDFSLVCTNVAKITILNNYHLIVKFLYSEKATHFCEIFPLLLSCVVPVRGRFHKILWPSQNIWTLSIKRHNFCDATKKNHIFDHARSNFGSRFVGSDSKKNHAMPTESNIPFCFYY